MLQFMRILANNLIFKMILIILLASFLIWGVSDIFRNNSNQSVASVGNKNITIEEFNHQKRIELARIQEIFGVNFNDDQLAKLKFNHLVLSKLINKKIIELEVINQNIFIGDKLAIEYLNNDPNLLDKNSNFLLKKFNELLASNRLTESEYLSLLKKQIAGDFLESWLDNVQLPLSQLNHYLTKYLNQQRKVSLILLDPHSLIQNVAQPNANQIEEYYQQHQQSLIQPELRSINYLNINKEQLMSKINITDEELEQYYQENLSDYQLREFKEAKRLEFNQQEMAVEFYQQLKNKSFDQLVDKVKDGIDISIINNNNLIAEFVKPLTDLEVGQVSEIIKTNSGFSIIKIQKSLPARVINLADAKLSIKQKLTQEKVDKELAKLIANIQSELDSGANLFEIAALYKLSVNKLDNLKEDEPTRLMNLVNSVDDQQNILEVIFNTKQDEDSQIIESDKDQIYNIIRVVNITNSKIMPLNEAKDLITSKIIVKEANLLAKNKIEQLSSNITNNNLNLADLEKADFVVKSNLIITHKDDFVKMGMSAEFVEQIFNLKLKQSTKIYHNNKGQYLIAILEDINNPAVKSHIEDNEKMLLDELRKIMQEEYFIYLQKKYPVKIMLNQ